jgi:hypothetical protein
MQDCFCILARRIGLPSALSTCLSGSIPCDVPDKQVGRIVQAIVLPEAWMDRVLAHIHLADDVEEVRHERTQTEQRLKRLGKGPTWTAFMMMTATVGRNAHCRTSWSTWSFPESRLPWKLATCWRTSLFCGRKRT